MDKARHHYLLGRHKTVTADQIASNYPKMGSWDKNAFSCIECGEYVVFVPGDKVRPHFKHLKRNETTDYCKLRISTLQSDSIYEKLGLPLYLKRRSKLKFDLYLGFYSLDEQQVDLARRENLKITITPFDGNDRLAIPHLVDTDKFPFKLTTLIKIDFASKKYRIKYSSSNAAKLIIPKWGNDAEGIINGSALFTYSPCGGRKIRINDEVTTDRDYYYLCPQLNKLAGLKNEKKGEVILKSGQLQTTYNVYKICFKPTNQQQFKKLAEFCREILKLNLVHKQATLTPIWPPVIYSDNDLSYFKCESEALYILESEEKNARVFMHIDSEINEWKAVELTNGKYIVTLPINKQRTAVTINEKYNTIYSFIGHFYGAIQSIKNELIIQDVSNNPLDTGVHYSIPSKGKIRVLSDTRCTVVQINNHQIRSESSIRDMHGALMYDIAYGDEIVVLFGNHTIPMISFLKPINSKNMTTFDHDMLYMQLKKLGPPLIVPPMWLKGIIKKTGRNTKLFGLIREYVFMNAMPTDACKVLSTVYEMEEESDRGGR